MAIDKLFKTLLGGAGNPSQPPADPVDYKGFTIEPEPIDEDGKFRTAGYISGDLDGEPRRIRFIRADQSSSLQAAVDHSIAKARQIIDEQGKRLLDKSHL